MTDSYDRNEYIERDLTPLEIDERTKLHLRLATERDENLAEVAGKRGEIRALNVARKKLDLREAQIRREIRSGKVLEPIPSPQIEFDLPDPLAALAAEYPKARDAEQLHTQLAVVLQGVLVPSIEKLEKWPPASGIFDAVAHWARVELAYMNRKSHPGLELPPRALMPVKLDEMRLLLERAGRKTGKKKAPRRAAGGKRKARA